MTTKLRQANPLLPKISTLLDDLVRQATAVDGHAPLSDQARLEAAQGNRTVTLIQQAPPTEDDHTPGSVPPPPLADPETTVGVAVLGQGELDLVIDPKHRGAGHASRALPHVLSGEPGRILAWAHGDNPAAKHLLTRAGFRPVRTLLRMALNPDLLPEPQQLPETLRLPEGTSLSTFSPEDAAEWVAVNAAAFASHPEQGKMTAADLLARQGEAWFSPQDFLLLRSSDTSQELLGFNWLKVERDSKGSVAAEIYAIGVAPQAAGRGMGGALMRAGLARMAEHRPSSVSLYVEGDNAAALGLYSKLGFTVASQSQQWLRPAIA